MNWICAGQALGLALRRSESQAGLRVREEEGQEARQNGVDRPRRVPALAQQAAKKLVHEGWRWTCMKHREALAESLAS